jgi:hypothetical protein
MVKSWEQVANVDLSVLQLLTVTLEQTRAYKADCGLLANNAHVDLNDEQPPRMSRILVHNDSGLNLPVRSNVLPALA